MREMLLVGIVAVICVIGIRRPFVGLLGYIWFALLRPDVLAWSYAVYPYSLCLAISTLIGTLWTTRSYGIIFRNPITLGLLALQIPILISVLTALVPDLCWYNFNLYERLIFMSLLVPILVRTVDQLRTLLLVVALSLGVLGVKFGLFGLIHGGVRFAAGYGGLLSDNNDLGLAFTMTIPLCWYLRYQIKSRLYRMGMMFVILCTVAGIVMTYSRGAAVASVCVLLCIALRSKRKVLVLAGLVIMAAPAVYLAGDAYRKRISTVADPEHEASSYSRIALAQAAVHMWKDYPLFGVGFGGANCARIVGDYTAAKEKSVLHNTWLQMLVDSGIFAFLIYCAIIFGVIGWLGRSARRMKSIAPDLRYYPLAIQTSLIGFAVGSTTLSRVNFDLYYILLVAAAAWQEIERHIVDRAADEDSAEADETPELLPAGAAV